MRMRILLIVSLSSLPLLSSIVDLGVVGTTYPVKEKSFRVSIDEGIRDFNVTAARAQVKKSFEMLVEAKYHLPLSRSERKYSKENTYVVPADIIGPQGKVVYRAGEVLRVPMPAGEELSLCFVDARYPRLLPKIAKQFGRCIYMIANNRLDGDYPSLLENSVDGRLYPVTDIYVKRFGITAFPTKIRLHGDRIEYHLLNMIKLMKESGIEGK